MKLEIGEYVRTVDGRIARCIDTYMEEDIKEYVFDRIVFEAGCHNAYDEFNEYELDSFIEKHSKDLIDLIEIGDFVNRDEVIGIEKKENKVINIIFRSPTIIGEIKSILTRELYDNYCYKIGEKE